MDLEAIRDEITHLSGSGKRVVSTRRNGIYSSFTIPGLDDMLAVRDTEQRFDDFGIPEDLSGKTFLDLGANVGAMAFEAARRGAVVDGVEYRADRVDLGNIIARKWELDAKFHQADFNDFPVEAPWNQGYDIVLCCSVDQYIKDRERFYSTMNELCKGKLYFECNVQRDQSVDKTLLMLMAAGFKMVEFLGNGDSGGISRKRKIYRANG